MPSRDRSRDVRPAPSVWGEEQPSVKPSVAPVHIQMPSWTSSVPMQTPSGAPVHTQMPSATPPVRAPVPVHVPSQPVNQPTGWGSNGRGDEEEEAIFGEDLEEDDGLDEEYIYSDGEDDVDADDEYDDYLDDIEETPPPPPSQPEKKSLAELYRRPHELMYHADFHSTMVHAARQDRWLLLNLQSTGEFTSQVHNRDLWANELIAQVVSENFVFSLLERYGAGDDDVEASKVCCFYKLHDQLPAVLVVDPITGQMLAKWTGVIEPDAFLLNIEEYSKSKPSMSSKPYMFQTKALPVRSAPANEPAGEQQQEPATVDTAVPMDEGSVQAESDTAAVPVDEHGVEESATSGAGGCSTQQPQPAADDHDDDEPMEGEKIYKMRIRFPDGSVVTKEFGCKRRVAALFAYCRSVLHEKPQAFKIKRLLFGVFSELPEGDKSFEDLGLNCATVSVVLDT
uniref:UBX domain-containing protein n=2 Tax=Oryza brachyantha TaxID=4533 RepID=J3LF75_ORYBR